MQQQNTMEYHQLYLFDNSKDPKKEVEKLIQEWQKTKKSLYARENVLRGQVNDLKHELELLKMYICKGKIVL